MASYLKQLSSKASTASQFASTHGSAFYKNLLENNKQYIAPEPTVQKCQELSKQLFYTRLARLFKWLGPQKSGKVGKVGVYIQIENISLASQERLPWLCWELFARTGACEAKRRGGVPLPSSLLGAIGGGGHLRRGHPRALPAV